jgi:hypothetical protein
MMSLEDKSDLLTKAELGRFTKKSGRDESKLRPQVMQIGYKHAGEDGIAVRPRKPQYFQKHCCAGNTVSPTVF